MNEKENFAMPYFFEYSFFKLYIYILCGFLYKYFISQLKGCFFFNLGVYRHWDNVRQI